MSQSTRKHFEKAQKVLFMSHLALGDYLYQRGYLSQLKQAYPQIQLDIWIDDFRTKKKGYHDARSDFLCQWIIQEPFVDEVYPIAKSEKQREALVNKAKKQYYDLVIFIGTARSRKFSKYARKIAGSSGYCAGVISAKFWLLDELLFERRLNNVIVEKQYPKSVNIRDRYKDIFSQLTGLKCHNELLKLPLEAVQQNRAKDRLVQWHSSYKTDFAILINSISTTSKRDYSWDNLRQVILELAQQRPDWLIIVNAPPHQFELIDKQVRKLRQDYQINALAYTSTDGVNELCAILSVMDAVLSVETAIIHFAALLGVSQVALMRSKTAYWCPVEVKQALVANKRIDELQPAAVVQACLKHLCVSM